MHSTNSNATKNQVGNQVWPRTGALLLVGTEQCEARAMQHAKRILCDEKPETQRLFDTEVHPDFRVLKPEGTSQWIKIDPVRELIQWAMSTPQIASHQVAVISPAHTLNLQAANALLKTLEEPSLNTVFILVTDKPSLIPATIRSRCHWIRLRTAEQFSNLTENNELKESLSKDLEKIRSEALDPVTVAGLWLKQDAKQVLYSLLIILHEKMTVAAQNGKIVRNHRWWAFVDNVIAAKRSLDEPNNPNVQLLFESLLIEYSLFTNQKQSIKPS